MASMASGITLRFLLLALIQFQHLDSVEGYVHITGTQGQSSFNTSMSSFSAFVEKYGRKYQYGSAEYEARRDIFERRMNEISQLNSRPGKLWNAGVNELADWTDEELKQLRGWRGGASPNQGNGAGTASRPKAAFLQQTGKVRPLPESVSWTHLRSVSQIYDQGACGSCWAISTATVLNANAEIHSGILRRFSVQELVSCVENPDHCGGSGGCDGATVELAMNYVMSHGISDESDSLREEDLGICMHGLHNNWQTVLTGNMELSHEEIAAPGVHLAQSMSMPTLVFGMAGWERLPENKYVPLMRAVAERGPVAVSAAAFAWSTYVDGIFDHCTKDAIIDHAVVLLGYGEDPELAEKYWLIQNSWGSEWGEHGRIRVLRRDTDSDECGVDNQPEVGTGCNAGPKSVTVCGMCGLLYDAVVPHFGTTY